MLGQTIGNYRVTGEIGAGGMGAVYEAEHALLGKKAAVKVLLPELSSNRSIVERFFNEAKATALIKHPGIVEIFDYGHLESGHAYIVMERLDGESLAARLHRKQRFAADEAIAIARDIATVLASAHAHGIVHRDLKPDNVFIVPDPAVPGGERAKILDFGIAKLATGTGSGSVRTQTGAVMGTPVYMAPEQCKGAGQVDQRADIYSLGCVLFEAVCGGPPFYAEGAGEIIAAHIHLAPPAPSTIVDTIPAALERVILRLLAKDPAERYGSMAEVVAALDEASGHGHATGRPAVTTANPLAATAVAAPTGPPTTLGGATGEAKALDTADPTSRRPRWLVPALAGVVLAGGVAIALIGAGGRGGDANGAQVQRPAATDGTLAAAPATLPDALDAAPQRAASKPAPATVTLSITSAPPGADVYRAADGIKVGATPYEVELARGPGDAVFILKKRGYHDERVSLSTARDGGEVVELTKRSARKPADEKPADEKPADEKPADEKPPDKRPRDKDGAYDPFGDDGGQDGAYKPF